MSLYFILLVITVLVPLVLSFDKKLQFWRGWKYLFPAILIVATIYISFDVWLTTLGVWGFNPRYHSNILLFGLPVEELLFFIVVPYASIFLHDAFVLYFPKIKLNETVVKIISVALIVLSGALILLTEKIYTVYIFTTLTVSLAAAFFNKNIISKFYVSFLLILVPFLFINGTLTGSFIENEVVWYNNDHILGHRIFTIPVEDFFYAFTLIFLTLVVRDKLKTLY